MTYGNYRGSLKSFKDFKGIKERVIDFFKKRKKESLKKISLKKVDYNYNLKIKR
jgi:hypothetical protein